MGITRVEVDKTETNERPVNIIQRIVEPVLISAKKFYSTNPKQFLELGLLSLFIFLTFLGQLVENLPWGWYAVFGILVMGYFEIFQKTYKLFKKRKNK